MNILFLMFALLTGCAFKESTPTQQNPSQLPVGSPSPSPSSIVQLMPEPSMSPEPQVSPKPAALSSPIVTPSPPLPKPKVKFTELRRMSPNGEVVAKRTLASENDSYVILEPIGLVDFKKDDLEFEIAAQNLDAERSVEVEFFLSPDVETPAIIKLKPDVDKGAGLIKFRVKHTQEALDQIRTGELNARIAVNHGGANLEVNFKLLRRPRRIETLEVDSAALAQHPKRFIDLAALKLSLIRILEVKSQERFPVEVGFDVRNGGSITTSTERIAVNQTPCSHSESASTSNDRFDEGIVILPITGNADNDSIWKALNNGLVRSVIQPNQILQVGLYAVGDKVRSLLQQGFPKQDFQAVQVVTGCRARCGEWPNSGMFFQPEDVNRYKPTVVWTSRGRPGASQDCIDLATRTAQNSSPVQRWTDPQPDEQKIVRCALWETSNGSAPWDLDIRFCASAAPGNIFGHPAKEFWTFQKATTSVQGGTKTSPVVVKLETANLKGFIRHLYPAEDKEVPQSSIAVPFASQFNLFN